MMSVSEALGVFADPVGWGGDSGGADRGLAAPLPQKPAVADCLPLASVLSALPWQQSCRRCPSRVCSVFCEG